MTPGGGVDPVLALRHQERGDQQVVLGPPVLAERVDDVPVVVVAGHGEVGAQPSGQGLHLGHVVVDADPALVPLEGRVVHEQRLALHDRPRREDKPALGDPGVDESRGLTRASPVLLVRECPVDDGRHHGGVLRATGSLVEVGACLADVAVAPTTPDDLHDLAPELVDQPPGAIGIPVERGHEPPMPPRMDQAVPALGKDEHVLVDDRLACHGNMGRRLSGHCRLVFRVAVDVTERGLIRPPLVQLRSPRPRELPPPAPGLRFRSQPRR